MLLFSLPFFHETMEHYWTMKIFGTERKHFVYIFYQNEVLGGRRNRNTDNERMTNPFFSSAHWLFLLSSEQCARDCLLPHNKYFFFIFIIPAVAVCGFFDWVAATVTV